MVAMHHFFFAVHAYCGRFCAKERIMAAVYANFPPLMPGCRRDEPRLFGPFILWFSQQIMAIAMPTKQVRSRYKSTDFDAV